MLKYKPGDIVKFLYQEIEYLTGIISHIDKPRTKDQGEPVYAIIHGEDPELWYRFEADIKPFISLEESWKGLINA